MKDGGIHFAVRMIVGTDPKRGKAAKPRDANPFLPYDEALFVGDVGSDHVCLLNKFPVLRDHALVVTRAFEEQQSPLEQRHFEALWTGLGEIGGLAFYNAGEMAGASQRHRHLQILPTPLQRGSHPTPIESLLDEARFDGPVGTASALPFLHALARLRSIQRQAPSDAASALHQMYREMARAFGCDRPGRPYNLLATRDWMLFVPRAAEKWQGISVNALAFAGAILVRDVTQLERVRAAGPMTLLRHAGVAARP